MRDFTFVHERIGTPAPVRLVLTLAEVYMRLLERASSDLPSQLVSLDRITEFEPPEGNERLLSRRPILRLGPAYSPYRGILGELA